MAEKAADGSETGRVIIPQSGLAELGRYIAGAAEWAGAAAGCLK